MSKLTRRSGKNSGARLSAILRRERVQHGLTQSALSAKSGVGLDTIRAIEQGRVANPGVFVVADLCQAMRVSISRLVGSARS